MDINKKIFCDIDGVLNFHLAYFMNEAKKRGFKNVSLDNDSYTHILDATTKRPILRFHDLVDENYFRKVKPVISASNVLRRLVKEGCFITLITKSTKYEEIRKEWLLRNGFPYPVIFLDNPTERAKLIQKQKPFMVIDDYVLNLHELVKRKLYLDTIIVKYEQPYNKFYINGHIYVCKNWKDIWELIKRKESRQ